MLTESNFLVYAMQNYDNPHCHELAEFEEDLKRFQYLRKLFVRYKQSGDLKERLILNHLIVLYNCFGAKATNMIFMKLEGFHDCVKPFVEYLNFMKDPIIYNGKLIAAYSIQSDKYIITKLKEI